MNSRNFIKLYLLIVGVVVILGLVVSTVIYEEKIMKKLESKIISFGINESSVLQSEKDITFIKTSIPFGESNIYNRIYIIHDNERNVTCYLYNDGISCIPDYYIKNKGGELHGK